MILSYRCVYKYVQPVFNSSRDSHLFIGWHSEGAMYIAMSYIGYSALEPTRPDITPSNPSFSRFIDLISWPPASLGFWLGGRSGHMPRYMNQARVHEQLGGRPGYMNPDKAA